MFLSTLTSVIKNQTQHFYICLWHWNSDKTSEIFSSLQMIFTALALWVSIFIGGKNTPVIFYLFLHCFSTISSLRVCWVQSPGLWVYFECGIYSWWK